MNSFLWHLMRKFTFCEADRLQKKFSRAAQQFEKTQQRVLIEKLVRNQNSEYGRRYNFSQIKTIDQFRRNLPLTTYEDVSPYIEKVKNGNLTAMFHPKEKIWMYALSSGTTAEPKSIPVTQPFLDEYKRGSLLWGVIAARDHDRMLEGKILPLVSPACEEKTGLNVPCGAISGLIAETQKRIARLLYPVPGPVYEIKDVETRDYMMLRFALAESVSFITTANPSTLIRLARSAEKYKEQLARDIYEGTFTPPSPVDLKVLKPWMRKCLPNKREGVRLQNLIQKGVPFIPKNFWPHLALIACWKGGTLSSYLPHVLQLYGEVPIRDLGLLASEGRMTLPMSDEGAGGVLDVLSHFYEFIPESEEETENPETLLGHQLKKGERYFIVLTTSSGLYRYQIQDLVEVESFYYQTPILRFLNKGKSFSSLTGEKISEYQVVQSVQRAVNKHRLDLERFIMAPKWNDPPHYVLLVEEDFSVDDGTWSRFIETVEQQLQKMNAEYSSKRGSLRLGPVQVTMVPRGTFSEKDAQELRQRSGRFEQYKPRFLSNDLKILEEYDRLLTLKNG